MGVTGHHYSTTLSVGAARAAWRRTIPIEWSYQSPLRIKPATVVIPRLGSVHKVTLAVSRHDRLPIRTFLLESPGVANYSYSGTAGSDIAVQLEIRSTSTPAQRYFRIRIQADGESAVVPAYFVGSDSNDEKTEHASFSE